MDSEAFHKTKQLYRYKIHNSDSPVASLDVVQIAPDKVLWSISSTGSGRWQRSTRRQIILDILNQIPEDAAFTVFHWIPGRETSDTEYSLTEPPLTNKKALLEAANQIGSFRVLAVSSLIADIEQLSSHPLLMSILTPPVNRDFNPEQLSFLDTKGYHNLLCTVNLDDPSKGFSVAQMAELARSPRKEAWRCGWAGVPPGTRVILLRQGTQSGVIGLGRTTHPPQKDGNEPQTVEVDWSWVAVQPPPGLDTPSLKDTYGNHAWDNQQSGIRLASWVGDAIEARLQKPTLPVSFDNMPADCPADVSSILRFLKHKPQLILYGPPGTGKTRLARRAAYVLLGGDPGLLEDEEQVEAVLQGERYRLLVFHPSYEYDQLIGGLTVQTTPEGTLRYEAQPGVLTRLCEQASRDERHHVLIIDEINRGNLPKLLGELLYALEYRGSAVTFSFDGRPRVFPKNLVIIGTMNTADRSVASMDAAIRRRFAFHRIAPDPGVVSQPQLRRLMERINAVLSKLSQDLPELSDLLVGHSYFLGCASEADFDLRWSLEVRPLLEEYAHLTGAPDVQKLCERDWRSLVPTDNADADGA